jgi:tight adherence protein B
MASWGWELLGWLDATASAVRAMAAAPLSPLARARALQRLRGDEAGLDAPVGRAERGPPRAMPPAIRRYGGLAYLAGTLAAGGGALLSGGQVAVIVAAGVVAGTAVAVAERALYDQRVLRLETQLADALDLMVAGLRAGSPLLAALEQAARESAEPLRGLLSDVTARVRLGAVPGEAFAQLAARTGLESFQLFALAMTVQWDVGGSLAPSLAQVGRGVRDRIDLARRVRAMSMQARLSMLAVMAVVYLLAALMWANNPERMQGFLRSTLGTWLTCMVAALQVLGVAWAARLARFDA